MAEWTGDKFFLNVRDDQSPAMRAGILQGDVAASFSLQAEICGVAPGLVQFREYCSQSDRAGHA